MEMKQTIADVFKHLRTAHPNPKALNELIDGKWSHTSTQQLLEAVEEICLGLTSLGIEKGQNISIFAYPSSLWTIIDFAIIIAGAVSVPIFPNISEENLVFQINQSKARFVFLGEDIGDLFVRNQTIFDRVISINEKSVDKEALQLEKLRQMGRDYRRENPNKFEQLLENANPHDIATIIYTSGSTGIPKGAELTNSNLVAFVSFKGFSWNQQDRYLSILPLAHVFGRTVNICIVAWNISVYYLNNPKMIAQVCHEIHPTILVVVPRLLEKVYSTMLSKVESAGFLKRAIGHWAFDLANDEHDDSLIKQVFHPIADKVVYSTLRAAFGGSVRLMISGGAPLNPHLAHFYIDIGLQVYEGWGMTEASTITCNLPGKRKISTVGQPLDNMKIKLSSESEILIKGPVVMKGYHQNEEATKAAFDAEGWLKTGDKGEIDQEGYLTIVGRLKELLKTSTGEYVVPVAIEQMLSKIPLVDMSMVVAERRKFTTCLIFVDQEILRKLKDSKGQSAVNDEDFLNSETVRQDMQKAIDQINTHLNKSEKIHEFRFIAHSPTIEGGELTPSMKIRRDAVEKKYSTLINSMYPKESI